MTPVIFINCKEQPFIERILTGQKVYETRNRNTLGRFIGERVLLAETGNGRPVIKASATIDFSHSTTDQAFWTKHHADLGIDAGSRYDWQPETKIKWLYHLTDVTPVSAPSALPSDCRRHGRVWAELPDLSSVSYWYSGGNTYCYSALYKGMYWIFGNEDYMRAFSIDPSNDDDTWDGDPNPYEIEDAADFPTWREVIDSIPESVCDFYWIEGRDGIKDVMTRWQGSLDKHVNEE